MERVGGYYRRVGRDRKVQKKRDFLHLGRQLLQSEESRFSRLPDAMKFTRKIG
jgi:hypothetical protein